MALTFTEKFRDIMGDKVHVIYEVTHDGAVLSMSPTNLGMKYIDYCIAQNKTALSSVADFSYMSDSTGTLLKLATTLSTGSIDIIEAWGT